MKMDACSRRNDNRTQQPFEEEDVWLRPFGLSLADLDVDFGAENKPELVTEILRCCARNGKNETPSEDFFWGLTVGKRIEFLFMLVSAENSGKETFVLECADHNCRQLFEIELEPQDIAGIQRSADQMDFPPIVINGRNFKLRRPTGADQRLWLKGGTEDTSVKSPACAMVSTLLDLSPSDQPALTAAALSEIENALEKWDPLVNMRVVVTCPICGGEGGHAINLQDHCLRRLREMQAALISVVHSLARAYHWSEEQILSIPPWRRAKYLALVERETAS